MGETCQAKFVKEMPDGRSLWKCEACEYRFAAEPGRSEERCYKNRDEEIWPAVDGSVHNPLPIGDWVKRGLWYIGVTPRRYRRWKRRVTRGRSRGCDCGRRRAALNHVGLRLSRWWRAQP